MRSLDSIVDARIKAYEDNLNDLFRCGDSITKKELDLVMLDIGHLESIDYYDAANKLRGLVSEVRVRNSVYCEVLYVD